LTQHTIANMDKSSSEYSAFMDKFGLNEVNRFRTQKALELKILQDYLKKGILSEKDATRVRAILASEEFRTRTKDFKDAAGAISDISGMFSNAFQGFQQADEKSIETKYQKQIDAAKKAGTDTTKIEEQKNAELAKLRADNADAMFALQVASIIASTAVSAIDAYASALKVPGIGLVLAPIAAGAAVAYGASQVAIAEAAREAAKEGYWTGGFTEPGDKYKPAGIVHAGEFVGNQDAVRSAPIRKVFNLIDYAQKTNTVAQITNEDITRALAVRQGYTAGGFVSSGGSSAGSTVNIDMSAVVATMQQTNAVNMALLAQLQKGIIAKYKISGDDGVVTGIDEYNNLLKQAGK